MKPRYAELGVHLLGLRRRMERIVGGPVSQEELIGLLDRSTGGFEVAQSQVSRWERGEARPRREALDAYAELAASEGIEGFDRSALYELAGYLPPEGPRRQGPSGAEPPSPTREASPRADRPARTRTLAVLGLSLVALCAAVWAAYERAPRNPTSARIEGHRLEVYSGERLLWSCDLGEGAHSSIPPLVRDLDGDGRNGVLAPVDGSGPDHRRGQLLAFSSDGRERWSFTYGRALQLGDRTFSDVFGANHLAWLDTPRGPFVLLVALHERWFPTQVVLLDPATGRKLGEYWHPGFLETFTTFDVDGDGTVELLLGGTNNPGTGPGMPCLAVLDLPFRPAAEPDSVFGLPSAQEHAYLLFPRSDLYDATTGLASVHSLDVQAPDRLVVSIWTSAHDSIYYYLDRHLEVTDFRVSDTFVERHDQILGHRYSEDERLSAEAILRFRRAPNANRLLPPPR